MTETSPEDFGPEGQVPTDPDTNPSDDPAIDPDGADANDMDGGTPAEEPPPSA